MQTALKTVQSLKFEDVFAYRGEHYIITEGPIQVDSRVMIKAETAQGRKESFSFPDTQTVRVLTMAKR